jgi:SOS-response transcriptional repressor LexA
VSLSVHRLIRTKRRELGLTESQFAEALGVSRGAVQQWERPGGTAPNRSNQPKVAKLLGISVEALLSGDFRLSNGLAARSVVALVSEVEAGNYTTIDNFAGHDFETVAVTTPVMRHTYALRVHGDSMVSEGLDSFPEGSIIIVEPEMQPNPGDYVIALNNINQTTFKQLVQDDGDLYLKPLNPRYPIKPLGEARVIGVVRELIKRFR